MPPLWADRKSHGQTWARTGTRGKYNPIALLLNAKAWTNRRTEGRPRHEANPSCTWILLLVAANTPISPLFRHRCPSNKVGFGRCTLFPLPPKFGGDARESEREEGRELPNSEILSNIKVSNSYSAITPALLRSNNRLLQDSQLLFQQGDQPGVKVIVYCHPFWQQDHAGDAVRGKEIERVQKQNDVRIQHQHRTISISTPIITFDFIFFTFRY